MFWIKFRSIIAVTLTLGIASGMVGAYVGGSQGMAPQGGLLAQQPPTTVSAQASPPENAAEKSEPRARQLATRKAKLIFDIAKLTRELAELAVVEYEEVTYPQDLTTAEGGIALAKSDLERAKDRLEWSKRMVEKRYVAEATKVSDELTLERARFEVEQAETARDVLTKYTRDKTLKQLRAAVEKALADEESKQATWKVEQATLELEKVKRNAP